MTQYSEISCIMHAQAAHAPCKAVCSKTRKDTKCPPVALLLQEAVRGAPPPDKKLLEHQFVFACVWAFGGCMLVDKVSDYRTQFSKWWISEYKNVQFPEKVQSWQTCGQPAKYFLLMLLLA